MHFIVIAAIAFTLTVGMVIMSRAQRAAQEARRQREADRARFARRSEYKGPQYNAFGREVR